MKESCGRGGVSYGRTSTSVWHSSQVSLSTDIWKMPLAELFARRSLALSSRSDVNSAEPARDRCIGIDGAAKPTEGG